MSFIVVFVTFCCFILHYVTFSSRTVGGAITLIIQESILQYCTTYQIPSPASMERMEVNYLSPCKGKVFIDVFYYCNQMLLARHDDMSNNANPRDSKQDGIEYDTRDTMDASGDTYQNVFHHPRTQSNSNGYNIASFRVVLRSAPKGSSDMHFSVNDNNNNKNSGKNKAKKVVEPKVFVQASVSVSQ